MRRCDLDRLGSPRVVPKAGRCLFAFCALMLLGCEAAGDSPAAVRPPFTERQFELRVAAGERVLGEVVLDQRRRDDMLAGGTGSVAYHDCDFESLKPERIEVEVVAAGIGASSMVVQLARCGDAAVLAYQPFFERSGQSIAFERFVEVERAMDAAIRR